MEPEPEEEQFNMEKSNQDTEAAEIEELQWKPELIWTSPPKPIPGLDDHPLLRNLPTAGVAPQNPQYVLPPIYPHVPPPTLYMEPLLSSPKEDSTETTELSREPGPKKAPNTPTSSPPASPHSYPSSGSAAKLESPGQCQHTGTAKGKRKETQTVDVEYDRPRCTLHYYRQIRNASAEGFHVLQGQVWHGQSPTEEGEGQIRRKWRRHQWVIDR